MHNVKPSEPAFVATLNDILAGKYDNDLDKYIELFEGTIKQAQAEGKYEEYEKGIITQVSNHLTELLEKAAA